MIGAINSNLRTYGAGPSSEADTSESTAQTSLHSEDNTDATNQSNETNTEVDNQTCSYNDSITNNDYGCQHNGQAGVSAWDIAEHIGNGEWGSAARDVFESSDTTGSNNSDNTTADNGSATEK